MIAPITISTCCFQFLGTVRVGSIAGSRSGSSSSGASGASGGRSSGSIMEIVVIITITKSRNKTKLRFSAPLLLKRWAVNIRVIC